MQTPLHRIPAGRASRARRRPGPPPAIGCRLGVLVAAALVSLSAHAGSLKVRDPDGSQWRAVEDPADEAQGYVLERVLPDGKLDPRFGRGGRSPLSISGTNDAPTSVRVDAGRRIWVTGASIAGGQPQAVIERFLPDGALDLRWGVQGKVQLSPGGLAIKPNDLVPLADGSVLVAGVAANLEPTRAVVFRLKPNGALDFAFAPGGTWQRGGASDGSTATSLDVNNTGAVAVAVAARGENAAAEIWSLAGTAPRRLFQQPLEESSDGEDLGVAWSGQRWVLVKAGGATLPGAPATLQAPSSAVDGPVSPAAPASSDPGQGGFIPFAAGAPTEASSAPGPLEDGMPWGIGFAIAIFCAVVGMRLARGRRPGPVIRAGKG